MGKNFKTSAAAAFISGIVQADADSSSAKPADAPVRAPKPKTTGAKASIKKDVPPLQAAEAVAKESHQINGKDVVVIYRRPRKGDKVERRTRQAHLLMLPSLYKEAQKYAKANGISFNAMVEDALLAYLGQHKEN